MKSSTEVLFIEAVEDIESSLGTNSEPYDVSEWVNGQLEQKGLQSEEFVTFERKKAFSQICKVVREEFNNLINLSNDGNLTNEQQKDKESEFLERQHKAVIGDEKEMAYFISKITEILRRHNITSKDYSTFYSNLAEAVFHEVWGISLLQKWEQYPNSEAAVIRGQELWIDIDGKFIKQEERFSSIEDVERIKRTFTMRNKDAIINEQTPELEVEKENGDRVTMIQKPRSRDNYVMFRRFIVKDISLEEQARLNTIPTEDIEIHKALSRTMPNTIIAGRVRSAKSTFMKSLLRERDPYYVMAVIEKHFELALSEQMPDRLCFEVQAKEGDLHLAIPRLLRMEHDFIVVGEIRSLETEGYLQACERGERGAASTYHLTDVENVVPQITRHLLDEFPNRSFENEVARVAKSIDIVYTMGTDRDRRRKRVVGVTEIIWNEEKKSYSTNDLIKYSRVTEKYYYSANISKELLSKMAEENLEETKKLVRLLKERQAVSPMSDYHNIANSLLIDLLGEDVNGV
ncbi:ATPase, T2SS/T4P/T4SS family (plasmid) [Metabacillus halosaccharovorans]|uniref:ATPase, T2SS/T4P/T4SS family n=1 Tax=Metabacillus halosaccharovorans TaxID=930124 RepID=UPI0020417FEB|nr:ATPase, T2SS/T4P/T4SS family [Metabacillus halosaccharovorans]MCM3441384.1 Flp pilus assembly complex ATPase component TadA [Metabacillus halosaccharovorans]